MIIDIPEEVWEKCQKFALECSGTNKDEYARRNQTNMSKIQLDITIGKVGEWVAQQFIGEGCSSPDFEIYGKKKKSFDADLTTADGFDVHVKSQSEDSRKKYGVSWLFQKRDPLYRDPQEHDLILGVSIDNKNMSAEVVMFGKVKDLVFGECKVFQLRHSKVAIYLEENPGFKL